MNKVYEIAFLFVPNLSEDEAIKKAEELKALIADFKGEVVAESNPVMIDLAYEMRIAIENKYYKFQKAYFGWVKFSLSTDATKDLEKKLKSFGGLLRSMLIETVKENTVSSKKSLAEVLGSRKRDFEGQADVAEEIVVLPETGVEATPDELVVSGGDTLEAEEQREEESKDEAVKEEETNA